jgi:hypothetical protein
LSFYFQEYGESAQSDREEVLGQKRKEISPGICSNVVQVGKNNENSSLEALCGRKTKPSSASQLLELLDTVDDHSDCNSKSMSEPDTLWNSCASKKNLSVEYLPAGTNLYVPNKTSKVARDTISTRLSKEQKPAGIRNNSHTLPSKITNNCDTVVDFISSRSTNVLLDAERNEMQSSVIEHTKHCDEIAKKKQLKLVSMLHRLKTDANSINENGSCRTENIGGVPRDITEKETSVSARSLFQVIANNVENSTQVKRQKVFDGVKNNSISPYSISYMKPERHNTALGAVFKQEASGSDTCVRSVNSLAR